MAGPAGQERMRRLDGVATSAAALTLVVVIGWAVLRGLLRVPHRVPHARGAHVGFIHHFIFGVPLVLALRLWHLDQNGYGRQYYAAGVRSMMDGAHAFFYNAFDPAAFLSIDKPPVALWMQVLSARLLGFSAFSVMLTQVVLGVLSVWLLHRLVARPFGRAAALVAALCLALTPISVAVDRSNNTESALTLVLLLAAWALLRATEVASGRLLVLAMALTMVLMLALTIALMIALTSRPSMALTTSPSVAPPIPRSPSTPS